MRWALGLMVTVALAGSSLACGDAPRRRYEGRVDRDPPVILALRPSSRELPAGTRRQLALRLSEPLDAETVPGAVTLSPLALRLPPLELAWDDAALELLVRPLGPWPEPGDTGPVGDAGRVELRVCCIRDRAGRELSAPFAADLQIVRGAAQEDSGSDGGSGTMGR